MEALFGSPWAWVIGGLVLAGLEILVSGVFLLWIGLGAIAVGLILAAVPGLPLPWQALAFAASMLASLGLGFVIQRRSGLSQQDSLLNRETEAMVGQRYVAITAFAAGRGRIKVRDSSFAALSDDAIAAGDLVDVVAIRDGKPQVAKVPATQDA